MLPLREAHPNVAVGWILPTLHYVQISQAQTILRLRSGANRRRGIVLARVNPFELLPDLSHSLFRMKVLVIGSGPIVIGQAAEFDYAGTQACKSLKEEGHQVVLINSNPATIMTDPGVSDALYIEPLNVDFCERVIKRERPDALLPTLGGQTGLNLATQLADAGILEKYNIKVLGTPLSAIKKAEDRESFRSLMQEIKEPVPESWIVQSESELAAVLDIVPYPCIIRPAYTLGGTGGGIANTREELWETGRKGLKLSMRSQLMIERSLLGWKEIEYEVMRDANGTCIAVCNMENFDPMGVHTGDSIVVAPSQTLSDQEYHMMRTASLKIINALGIEGGCNVQMALNPDSFDYYIIEVNPRVSRSSALASKATGYPIARVAAKIAVGLTLDQIDNQVTGSTKACFEPALDYCVVKIPRWPFDKFATGDRSLFTQMKATGEVMAIDRSFEAALMKAIRGLEVKPKDLRHVKFQGDPRSTTVPVVFGNSQTVQLQTEIDNPSSTMVPVAPRTTSQKNFPDQFSPGLAVTKREGINLPHWNRQGGVYAVTFRLADSVPVAVLKSWREDRDRLAALAETGQINAAELKMGYQKLITENVERYLDAGHGEAYFKRPKLAEIVVNSIKYFDVERYRLFAWCVMPNHVHAVLEPLGKYQLDDILEGWKTFSAREINKTVGRVGRLWQGESYDHLIKSRGEFAQQIAYVERNPAQAKLGEWPWVSSCRMDQIDFMQEDESGSDKLPEGDHGDRGTTGVVSESARSSEYTADEVLPEGDHGDRGTTGVVSGAARLSAYAPDEKFSEGDHGDRGTTGVVSESARLSAYTSDEVIPEGDHGDRGTTGVVSESARLSAYIANETFSERDHGDRGATLPPMPDEDLRTAIQKPTDERLWAVAEGLRRGWTVEAINKISRIDKWFLRKIKTLITIEQKLDAARQRSDCNESISELIQEAFIFGFPSPSILSILGVDGKGEPNEFSVRVLQEVERQKVMPVFKMVDTCAGEFESRTPYYYGTFEQESDMVSV